MNRRFLRTAVGLALLLSALCIAAMLVGAPPEDDGTVFPSRVERLRGLAEVWGMVYYFHPALADPQKQKAWETELLHAIPAVEAAGTVEEYAMALQGMISALGDGVTSVRQPQEATLVPLPIDVAYREGKTVVTAIYWEESEPETRIVGFELTAVGGVSVSEFLAKWLPYASGETPDLQYEWVYGKLLSAEPGMSVPLQLIEPDGNEVEISLTAPTESELWARDIPIVVEKCDDDLLHVRIPSLLALAGDDGRYSGELAELRGFLPGADGVVLDLRSAQYVFGTPQLARSLVPTLLSLFLSDEQLTSQGFVQREHRGLVADVGVAGSVYETGWRILGSVPMASSASVSTALVVLVDAESCTLVAPYLQPLQQTGNAIVMGEVGMVPFRAPYVHTLPAGLFLTLRLFLPSDHMCPDVLAVEAVQASVAEMREGIDKSLNAALDALRNWQGRERREPAPMPELASDLLAEDSGSLDAATARESRLVGLLRLWNAVKYFYGYPQRIDGDWSVLLEEFIPIAERADTDAEYAKALQLLLAHLQDGHAMVEGFPWLIRPIPPVDIREIEDQAVVVSRLPVQRQNGGVEFLPPGQVILEVNGDPVEEVIDERLEWISGATDAHRRFIAHQFLLGEIEQDDIELLIRGEAGETRVVQVCRDCRDPMPSDPEASWWVDGGIGYLDICAVMADEYAAIEPELRAAEGILIDLRGYQRAGMMSATAAVGLLSSGPIRYIRTEIPVVSTPDPNVRQSITRWPLLYPPPTEAFDGPVVVLTDVRAISQAETMAMALQDGCGAVVVGERTAGTNGNVTGIFISSELGVWFSGMSVSHVDGRPFQGIGIVPDVEVHPTIQGIREGRDEILEKGLEVLRELIARRQGND